MILKIFKSLKIALILASTLTTSCSTATHYRPAIQGPQPRNIESVDLFDENVNSQKKSIVTELDTGIFSSTLAKSNPISAEPPKQANATTVFIAGLSWPTDTSFLDYLDSPEKYLQATESGIPGSGGFGFVRENNTKYHQGMDLKSFKRNGLNEPMDQVLCIQDGIVAYVNSESYKSSYGKYVVVEHIYLDIKIYSLYAHLSEINDSIKEGSSIRCGQILGVMGRTSNVFKIAKDLAHLHFEVGLQLGDQNSFQSWYDETYEANDKNFHGQWNGLNLIGIDPIAILKALNNGDNIASIIEKEPTALTTRTFSNKIPYFAEKYDKLLGKKINANDQVVAWDIEWTWYGLPKKLTPRVMQDIKKLGTDKTSIIEYRKSTKNLAEKRDLFSVRNWQPIIGDRIHYTIKKLGL
ncbi:MAG: M23 family metallopeptidase [Puniceicoccales bacterium]|jgi:murein DD-endopeptidase MepM/ murein hydrolase activator NlpD|nr:M23 family metallopeptidase [Puniceicoccales bacterium]